MAKTTVKVSCYSFHSPGYYTYSTTFFSQTTFPSHLISSHLHPSSPFNPFIAHKMSSAPVFKKTFDHAGYKGTVEVPIGLFIDNEWHNSADKAGKTIEWVSLISGFGSVLPLSLSVSLLPILVCSGRDSCGRDDLTCPTPFPFHPIPSGRSSLYRDRDRDIERSVKHRSCSIKFPDLPVVPPIFPTHSLSPRQVIFHHVIVVIQSISYGVMIDSIDYQ